MLVLGNTKNGEAVLEGLGLDGKETAVVEEGSGVPQLRINTLEESWVAGQATGLGNTPWVAEDNVLLLAENSVAQNGVGVVGNDVAAPVVAASGVGVGRHRVDGLEVHAVGADKAEHVVGRVVLGHEVVRLLAVDLSHGLDGVTTEGLGDVGALRRSASDPLGKGLLVQRGPDVSAVAGAAVHGLVVGVVDRDLVVHLDSLSLGVVVTALVVELDSEALLVVLVHVDAGGAVDGGGVGPEDGEQSSNQPAVTDTALDGIIKVVQCLLHLTNLEQVEVANEALVDPLEEVVVHVAPGAVGRRPLALLHAEWADQLVDALGNLVVGQSSAERVSLKHDMKLAVLHASALDRDLLDVLEADVLKVLNSSDLGEVRSHDVALVEDPHLLLRQLHGLPVLLVELQASEEDRVVLHVEELVIVGLEDIAQNLLGAHRLSVDLSANESLNEGIGVDGTDSDILGGRVRAQVVSSTRGPLSLESHVEVVVAHVEALRDGSSWLLELLAEKGFDEGVGVDVEHLGVGSGTSHVAHVGNGWKFLESW